jgi:hypothetical protein
MICGPGGPGRTAHGGLGQTALPLMLGSLPIRDELRPGGLGQTALVRLRVHTNSGVKVLIGQSTGCP